MTLDDIKINDMAVISGFLGKNADMIIRLREIGFAEGDKVQPLHAAGFSRDPICVRINGALIALRRSEARMIEVQPCP